MSTEEYLNCLEVLCQGKSKKMCELLGVTQAMASRWKKGHALVGKANARILRMMMAGREA